MWITFAKTPLYPDEVRHALAVRSHSVDIDDSDLIETWRLISICAGLVVLDSETGLLRLFHYSTDEFLQRQLQPGGNIEIAMTSLRYLSFPPFSNPFGDHDAILSCVNSYKLCQYAIFYLSDHVRGPSEDEFMQPFLKRLRIKARGMLFFKSSTSCTPSVRGLVRPFLCWPACWGCQAFARSFWMEVSTAS
jgi:hypothetical protein